MRPRIAVAILIAVFALAGALDFRGAITTATIAAERAAVVIAIRQEYAHAKPQP
jgi:hypothetical protein